MIEYPDYLQVYQAELEQTLAIVQRVFQKNAVYGRYIFKPLSQLRALQRGCETDSLEHSLLGEVIDALESNDTEAQQYFEQLLYQLGGAIDAFRLYAAHDGSRLLLEKWLAAQMQNDNRLDFDADDFGARAYTQGMVNELKRLSGEV